MTKSQLDEKRIRNLIETTESDVARLIRPLENSAAIQAARILEHHDANKVLIASIRQASVAFGAHANLPQWAEVSSSIRAAHRTFARATAFAALQRNEFQKIAQNVKSHILATNRAILPVAEALQAVSANAARAIQPFHNHIAEIERWHSSIAQQMATLTASWAMRDRLDGSVVDFSRVARLHDLSTRAGPFDPQTVEVFDEERGQPVSFGTEGEPEDRESAAVDAGLSPEIVAFPALIYPRVLFSAGFEFSIEGIGDVQSDSGDKSGAFDPQYSVLLQQVENRLRMMVETELRRLAGERWYRSRVPGSTWQRWQERKEEDRRRRGDSFRLIFYADFTDLSEIICRKDNWKDAFRSLFVSKDDLQVSLQRLNPIRNAIAHNRPLVCTDQITLFSEACRILTALGVRF